MTVVSRLTGHGFVCEADKQIEDQIVHCGETATAYVLADGRDRPVCDEHLRYWLRDHPDERQGSL